MTSETPSLDAQIEMALNALGKPERSAFLRACAIDVLPHWPAPPHIAEYLWTGLRSPSDDLFSLVLTFDSRVQQSAALAAYGEVNAWYHAANAEKNRGSGPNADRLHRRALYRMLACARGMQDRSSIDLEPYRDVWIALETRVPLTEILQWGDVEDAWVEADRRQSNAS